MRRKVRMKSRDIGENVTKVKMHVSYIGLFISSAFRPGKAGYDLTMVTLSNFGKTHR